jgi:hypothetical protein
VSNVWPRREPPSEFCLDESDGVVKCLRVVMRQVNLLPTLDTDDRCSLSDAQHRLILLRVTGDAADRKFENCARIDHVEKPNPCPIDAVGSRGRMATKIYTGLRRGKAG